LVLPGPARPLAQSQGSSAPPAAPAPPPSSATTSTQPEPVQGPTFRGGINFVRVDVIVSDNRGNPVTNLRQEDFELTEDGKPQKIEAFKLVNVTAGGIPGAPAPRLPRAIRTPIDEEMEAARDDVRVFAVFLDDYHVTQSASMRARQILAEFVETQLQDLDLIGTMYPLTPVEDIRLTRDRGAVAGAIRQFLGRKGDYVPRNSFEERYAHMPVSTVETIRNQVSMSALKGLITRLGGLRDGRKAIIMVSEGFTNLIPPQRDDPIASIPGSAGRVPPDPVGQQDPRRQSAEFFAESEMQTDLRDVFTLANRFNTSIYALDPRGLTPFEYDLSGPMVGLEMDRKVLNSTMDSLRVLADETDGRAIVNQNDLAKGLRQMMRDSSAYYLIGYSSTQAPTDGKFHEIKVRVRRPNTDVRARKGYWAFTAEDRARAEAPAPKGPPAAVETALAGLDVPDRRRLIRSWVGMAPGANGKTQVTFIWEPIPPPAGARGETAARVSLIAGGGLSELYFRGKTPEALPTAALAGAAAASPQRIVFEVPPGPLDLQLAIEDAGAQVLDREARKITVADLSGAGLVLHTPQVFRARTVREWQTLATEFNTVPLPGREFRRTDRLLIRVVAQSSTAEPVVSARLLNRLGQEMTSPLTVTPAGRPRTTNVDAPLASIPVGDYLIEITVAAGSEQTTSLVAFRVTG
jgi:VWFA-related protein